MSDASDLAFAGIKERGQARESRVLLLVLLKSAQYLCYVPKPGKIPLYIARFIVKTIYPQRLVKQSDLMNYSKSGTSIRHVKLIRNALGFTESEAKVRQHAAKFAHQSAQTKTRFLDVLNSVIESLISAHYELPSLSTLERISRSAVVAAKKSVLDALASAVSADLKCKIDALLESEGATQHSQWQKLKESGEIPQKSTLSEYWASFDALAQLSAQLPPLLHVTAERKQQMVSEALSLHSREMRRLSSAKRYALAVALIEYRWAQSLDQLVTLLIKILREIESTAIRLYAEKIMQQGDKTSFLVSTLKDILYHWGATDSTDERQNYLDTLYNTRGETLIDACHQHLAHQSEGHRPAMVKLFVKKRTILMEIIKRLPIAADANCRLLVNFKSKILSHSKKHGVITIDKDQYDLSWLSKAWQELAITHDPNTSVQHVHLHTLEIAWFTAIKNNFKSYHCFVEGAHAYGNPENYMVTWQKFDELLPHTEEFLPGLVLHRLDDEDRVAVGGVGDRGRGHDDGRLGLGHLDLHSRKHAGAELLVRIRHGALHGNRARRRRLSVR